MTHEENIAEALRERSSPEASKLNSARPQYTEGDHSTLLDSPASQETVMENFSTILVVHIQRPAGHQRAGDAKISERLGKTHPARD